LLDITPLAAYCDAYGRWITAERLLAVMADKDAITKGLLLKGSAGSAMANPLVKIARYAAADMVRYAGEFGMTPRARSYLDVAGRTSGPGKFDGLLA
jgi:P27 family predicted phage terminase small subunit